VRLNERVDLGILLRSRSDKEYEISRKNFGSKRVQLTKFAKESNFAALRLFWHICTMDHSIALFPQDEETFPEFEDHSFDPQVARWRRMTLALQGKSFIDVLGPKNGNTATKDLIPAYRLLRLNQVMELDRIRVFQQTRSRHPLFDAGQEDIQDNIVMIGTWPADSRKLAQSRSCPCDTVRNWALEQMIDGFRKSETSGAIRRVLVIISMDSRCRWKNFMTQFNQLSGSSRARSERSRVDIPINHIDDVGGPVIFPRDVGKKRSKGSRSPNCRTITSRNGLAINPKLGRIGSHSGYQWSMGWIAFSEVTRKEIRINIETSLKRQFVILVVVILMTLDVGEECWSAQSLNRHLDLPNQVPIRL
jgi:hypothetical protein